MSIELKIIALDTADLRTQLAAILGVSLDAAAPPAPVQEKPKAPEPEPVVEEQAPVADEPADDGAVALTYENDIKPAVLKVSAKGGRPAVEKLLGEFEVGNAKDVPEARWPEFLDAIAKVLG